jgi:two-component system, cell cycle sensor histidine kinase and response regulator CckA
MNREQTPLHRGSGTVLLVDDDEMIREFGRAVLEHLGYTVLTASGGVEGLEILERKRDSIGLVIIDLLMPFMSGFEMYERVLGTYPGMQVLVTSGLDFSEAKKSLATLDRERFIVKPFSLPLLSAALKTAMEGRGTP